MTCIDIVIVNWNAGNLLRKCVDSVIQYGNPFVSNIIIVDNGSNDGSESSVKGLSKVTLVCANENLGFGKACNLGERYCSSEMVLFLNPDAMIFSNTLSNVSAFMSLGENTNVGICGVQLYDEKGQIARSCSRFPSVKGHLSHAIGLTRIFPTLGSAMKEWDHSNTQEVDQVIGAFFLVRRELFQVLGGFDERFFVYFEEVDFSYRAKQLGWSSVYFSEAQAFHIGGGISLKVKAKRLFYSRRSRILYAFKHFNKLSITIILVATLLVEPISRTALILFDRSVISFKETWVAYAMLFRWLYYKNTKYRE
jgi:GT2 family glycosyltransferase